MNLQEIEAAFSRFKTCPRCGSKEGFWLGQQGGRTHAQCKGCGEKFELSVVFPTDEKKSGWFKFLSG